MQITRMINGKEYEIELTKAELYEAYLEQQHYYDKLDVASIAEENSDKWLDDQYGTTREVFMSLVDDMANEMRRNIDKYDLDWQSARERAVQDVLDEYYTIKE